MTYTADELNQTGIYAIINRDTGKRYIGSASKGFKGRWGEHKKLLRKGKHHSPHLQRAWNKHTEFRFEFKILEFVSPEYCIQREQWWMDLFGAYDKQYGYNMAPKAGSSLGYKHTEESRRNNSKAQKGKIISDETRKRLSEAKRASKYYTVGENNPKAKSYLLTHPDGTVEVIKGLKNYCKGKGLSASSLVNLLKGRLGSYKGYSISYYKENP